MSPRPRVVIAGVGDTGLLTAMGLAAHADVVAISSKAEFLTGQELGARIARPELWMRDNRIAFDRFKGLGDVDIRHGSVTGVDLDGRVVRYDAADGTPGEAPYDVLVIATGVSNGFWRRPHVQSSAEIGADLVANHKQLAGARLVAVIGGGAAAVNAAAHVAGVWPDTRVDLYFPGERAIVNHHRRVWDDIAGRLEAFGVGLHPGHRAELPDQLDSISAGPVRFTTGQAPIAADAVIWAVGRTSPNTGWLPPELLDGDGFVQVERTLQTPTRPEVFAIGDVAATDSLRCSARNRADRILVPNIEAHLGGGELKRFRPSRTRWGSVLGIQPNGIEYFGPTGNRLRFPAWTVDRFLIPWFLHRRTYGGLRRDRL